MEYYILCIALLAVLLYGVHFDKEVVTQLDCLSSFNKLRGFFAVLIVLGHCSKRFEKEVLPLLVVHKLNMVGVCFFLFISGWGLAYGYLYRGKDLKHFLIRKAGVLLAVSIVASFLYMLINEIAFGSYTGINPFEYILNHVNWYIWEAVYFYVIFYICARFIKSTNVTVCCVWFSALLICLLSFVLGWDRAFYFSAFSFSYGVTISIYWENISRIYSTYKKRAIFFLCALTAISVFSVFSSQESILGGIILRNTFGITGVSWMLLILAHISFFNKILGFLNRISLEIYLYQFTFMTLFKKLYDRYQHPIDFSYVVSVLGCVIIFAAIVSKVNHGVKNLVEKCVYGKPKG